MMNVILDVRNIFVIVGAMMLAWFVAPAIYFRIINIGNATGIALSLMLFLYGALKKYIDIFVKSMWNHSFGKCVVIFILIVAVGIFTTALIETVLMVNATCRKPQGECTLVVLGCRVYGERPSRTLNERIEAAYEYLIAHKDAIAILSGGKGDDELISEAECMYRQLVAKGIDAKRLIREDRSTSTRENLEFSNKIIIENGLNRNIALVTSGFHQYRALKVADKINEHNYAVSARTSLIMLPAYYIRELYGILYECVF